MDDNTLMKANTMKVLTQHLRSFKNINGAKADEIFKITEKVKNAPLVRLLISTYDSIANGCQDLLNESTLCETVLTKNLLVSFKSLNALQDTYACSEYINLLNLSMKVLGALKEVLVDLNSSSSKF